MCGIAGAVGPHASIDAVNAMLGRIAHRGEPIYACETGSCAGGVLGANRLAIRDEPRGRQPFWSADGSSALVLNGELYNAARLRRELGGDFRTRCDTEVALRAFLEWGPAFVDRLEGMYAIAAAGPGGYLLARDPLGIKPLYFGESRGTTWFASELKAFAHLEPDATLRELPPGSAWRPDQVAQHWALPEFADDGATDESELGAAVERSLAQSVESHLPDDGAVACLLSGGVDSSTVLLLAAALHAGPVEAWTLAAPGVPSDDLDAARLVCEALGVPLHLCSPAASELERYYVDRGVWMTETWEPALVRNAVSYSFLCRAVRGAGHKFCLSGEGADEVFGGYDYLWQLPGPERDAAIRDSLREVHRTYLQMADRASMAATLEVRVPYMDAAFVTAMAALGPASRMTDDRNKTALRAAHAGRLPERIRLRAKVGMNGGAGYGSNDPGASIYYRAVVEHYARNPERELADHELVRGRGSGLGVNLDDPEEVHNAARYIELGYDRLERRERPQLNVSQVSGQPVEAGR